MKMTIASLNGFMYNYHNERRGAKYEYLDTLTDTYKFGNNGDIYEVADKYARGLSAHKDPNGDFESGSDIEETDTSVKSWHFTLQTKYKAETFEEAVNIYFEKTASTNTDFGWIEENEIITYNMNHDEFKAFLYKFCKLERGVVRGPAVSGKKRQEIEKWMQTL